MGQSSLEAFPADPVLPRLKLASDPGLMREVFRSHLRPLSGKVYHLQHCLLSRVRYRRAERCVLQYTLRLVEPETGRERTQWVTGTIYPEHRARRIWQKLQAADPRPEIPEPWRILDPVSFIPDLGMLVQVFPYDRRLPTLPLLMAAPPRHLEPVFLAGFGPGEWRAEAWDTVPIRYRAELGVVLRCSVRARDASTDRKGEKRFYAKVYRDDGGQRTYHALQALWRTADGGGKPFTVGRPIAYVSDLHALFQEEVPGTPLTEILLQDRNPTLAMGRVARALAALHLDQVATTRHHPAQDQVTALKRAEKLIQWACPHLSAEVEAIVGTVAAGLEGAPQAPTHCDLKADHILLNGDSLGLLDLDSFARADPLLDAAALMAHLFSMTLRFSLPHDRLGAAARAFAEQYFAHVPRAWRSRLPLHYAGAALKEAAGFFRRQEPRWPEKVAVLVEEARNSLAGRNVLRR